MVSRVPTRRLARVGAVVVAAVGLAWAVTLGLRAEAVGTGYAARVGCSLVHVAGLDPDVVVHDYLVPEIGAPMRRMRLDVTSDGVQASLLGLADARAVYRPGLGCTLVAGAAEPRPVDAAGWIWQGRRDPRLPWPDGDGAPQTSADPGLRASLAAAMDAAFAEPGGERLRQTRALLVVHRGRLIAERYAPGINAATPMLSWSMAKSVLATTVGLLVADGRLDPAAAAAVPEWRQAGDPRGRITLDQLLRMSSGLAFDETYGAINDVSRMLFTRADAAAFAASMPSAHEPEAVWSYSSGTSNIVSRIVRDAFGGDTAAMLAWVRRRLLDPIGVGPAWWEPDAAGTPIGSSFVFLTARDWARLGELHRLDGVWQGRRILPEGWVDYVTTPTPAAPEGRYGAHWWTNGGAAVAQAERFWPALPGDAFSARGHSGQWVLVIPSAELVIVRLGIAFPDDGRDGAEQFAAAVLEALGYPLNDRR
jgi:CubicO group peptidase (beta-lactamase class C family)